MSELQCTIDGLDKEGWYDVLGSFRDGCLMQTWSYAKSRWPKARLSHVVVTRDGAPVAAAQVVLWTMPVVGGGLALVHYGPMWRPRSGEDDEEALELLLLQLRREYVERRRMSLRVKPRAFRRPEAAEAIRVALRETGYRLEPNTATDRFVVDLSPSLDELRAGLGSHWRYNLKRAGSNGLEIRRVSGPRGVEQFYALYDEMLERKSFVDHSGIDALAALDGDLPESMALEMLICEHEGEAVAGLVISVFGDTAEYLFGATADSALKLRAGYPLQWRAVEWLRERGVRWYDLGGGANDEGLRRFKEGLAGKRAGVATMPGEFTISAGLASKSAFGLAFAGRRFIRSVKSNAARSRPLKEG